MARKRRGRGEGGIYQRADGTWCASISLGYDGSGRRKRRVVYGDTKQQVQEKLKALHQEDGRLPSDTRQITVAQYLATWLESVRLNRRATTYDRYELLVRRQVVPHLGRHRVHQLTPLHVQEWLGDMERAGESEWSRFHAGVALNTAMRGAVKKGLLAANPCAAADMPKMPKREMRAWDSAQVKRFRLESAKDRLHAIYVLAVGTGMRQGEMFGLRWSDIDFDGSCLSVRRTLEELRGRFQLREPKTPAARRRIDLPAYVVTELHEHRKRMLAEGQDVRDGLVFCATDGGFLRKSNVLRRSFYAILKRADLPRIRFHDLRHTAASLLLMLGENPKVVQERLGHARVEVTLNTYSHVLPTMQKEAAQRLDRLLG
jgi:integrase